MLSRYDASKYIIKNETALSVPTVIASIRSKISAGTLSYTQIVTTGAERLDTMAGRYYGDGSMWWALATASNIGWGLQVPAGTVINIPDINQLIAEMS